LAEACTHVTCNAAKKQIGHVDLLSETNVNASIVNRVICMFLC